MKWRTYQLLIGINNYDDERFDQLLSPENGAQKFGNLLKEFGNFQTELADFKDSDKLTIQINKFYKNRSHDDILLFYFCGHGAMDEDDFYFITTDTDKDEVYIKSISRALFKKIMNRSNSQIQIVILDCCHSGGFGELGREEDLASKISKELELPEELKASRGRFILTSSLKRQSSFEDKDKEIYEEPRTFFTAALIDGIETGEADKSASGKITIDELFNYANVNIKTTKQQPIQFIKSEGSLELLYNPKAKITGELHYWNKEDLKAKETCSFLIKHAKKLINEKKYDRAIKHLVEASYICKNTLHDGDLLDRTEDLIEEIKEKKQVSSEEFEEKYEDVITRKFQVVEKKFDEGLVSRNLSQILSSKLFCFLGLVGVLTGVFTILISAFLTPNYNPLNNTVSSLNQGPLKSLFNIGLVTAGILGLPFYYYLERTLIGQYPRIRRIATAISMITCLSVAYLGIPPDPMYPTTFNVFHGIMVNITFTGSSVYIVLYSFVMSREFKYPKFLTYMGYQVGLLFISFIIIFYVNLFLAPLFEWILTLLILTWILTVVWYTLKQKWW